MFYILNIFQHFQYLKYRTFSLLAESAFFNPFFLEVKDDLRALFDLLTFLLPRSGSLQMSSGGYTRPITLSDGIEEIKRDKNSSFLLILATYPIVEKYLRIGISSYWSSSSQ